MIPLHPYETSVVDYKHSDHEHDATRRSTVQPQKPYSPKCLERKCSEVRTGYVRLASCGRGASVEREDTLYEHLPDQDPFGHRRLSRGQASSTDRDGPGGED
jgi:nucleotide-binding universal stress UspA family protein